MKCGLLSDSSTTSNGFGWHLTAIPERLSGCMFGAAIMLVPRHYGNHCNQSTVNAPFVTLIFGLHMSRFPRFFAYRAMLLARSDGLIRAPISTKNDGFFISRRYAIPEYSTGVFAALTADRGDDFSGLSIYGTPEPNFVFATKDKGPQLLPLQHRNLFAITGRSFFNEIFALTFSTAVSLSLDNHN